MLQACRYRVKPEPFGPVQQLADVGKKLESSWVNAQLELEKEGCHWHIWRLPCHEQQRKNICRCFHGICTHCRCKRPGAGSTRCHPGRGSAMLVLFGDIPWQPCVNRGMWWCWGFPAAGPLQAHHVSPPHQKPACLAGTWMSSHHQAGGRLHGR